MPLYNIPTFANSLQLQSLHRSIGNKKIKYISDKCFNFCAVKRIHEAFACGFHCSDFWGKSEVSVTRPCHIESDHQHVESMCSLISHNYVFSYQLSFSDKCVKN